MNRDDFDFVNFVLDSTFNTLSIRLKEEIDIELKKAKEAILSHYEVITTDVKPKQEAPRKSCPK